MNRGAISNAAVLKWAQTLTVQSGAGLYGVCGAVCVVLSALRKINAAELALVLVNAAALQRAADFEAPVLDVQMRAPCVLKQTPKPNRPNRPTSNQQCSFPRS